MKKYMVSLLLGLALSSQSSWYAVRAKEADEPKTAEAETDLFPQEVLVKKGIRLAVVSVLSLGIGWYGQDSYGDFRYEFSNDLWKFLQGHGPKNLPWYLAPLFFAVFFLLYEGVGWAIAYVYPSVSDDDDADAAASQVFQKKCIQKGIHWVTMCVLCCAMGYFVQNSGGDFPYWSSGLPKRLQGASASRLRWYLAPLLFMPFFLLCEAVEKWVDHMYADAPAEA